jgi:phosphogluconate dehydratase
VNHFNAAGGLGCTIANLLEANLLHADVKTVMGAGLEAYAKRPELDDAGNLKWQDVDLKAVDEKILRKVTKPFQSTGGLSVLKGNLGDSIAKTSAVKPEHQVVEAEARVFHEQSAVKAAFEAGELDRDVIVVVRFQGPKANGMPELHSLTPMLSVLQDRGYSVALITDGRMSGASGKVPAAIHLSPEAIDGGPIAKLRDGDRIRLDAQAGTLEVLEDAASFAARDGAITALSANAFGCGRELFTTFRRIVSSASHGASAIV